MKRILVVDDSEPLRKDVARLLEGHGYEVVLAEDGGQALGELSAGPPVDLVLLDLVMPSVDGYQFCRALRQHPTLSRTPVVLMGTETETLREKLVRDTGALDAITKPFDGEALVAMLENVLRRVEKGAGSEPPAKVPSLPPQEIVSSVEGRTLDRLLQSEEVLLYGKLSTLAIGAVLQLLQMEKQTGVLTVVHGEREVTTVLRDGLIDLVQSRGAGDEFRLGRFFIEEGLVTPEEIDRAVASRGPEDARPLGDILVHSGKVTSSELRAALLRQSSELVYELLRWKSGYFVLERRPAPPLAESAALRLPVASVVLEGVRRVDEWRLMEARVGRFDEALLPDPVALQALGSDRLSKTERIVLDLVDGGRTIREIITLAHMSSFDTCKALFQLLEARIVRRRPS